jgi:ankyrin repeat protein
VRQRNAPIAELLLEHEADINARDDAGRTVMHVALLCNAGAPLVELLLKHDPDLSVANDEKKTVLSQAQEAGIAPEVARLLQEHRKKGKRK